MNDWMIYGVTGYTGQLIVEEAMRQGLRPVLAGRSAERVRAVAAPHGLETRVFDLADPAAVAKGVAGMRVVLHCAGPFSATFTPMLDACLRAHAHYLDITGELAIFEALFVRDAECKEAGIVAVSGMGFDVVPTDCLAALLARELPDADHLALALMPPPGVSAGTAKSMIEGMGRPGHVRVDGRLIEVMAGHKTRLVSFEEGRSTLAVTIPLGDLVSAYRSTGIPNIETYVKADFGLVALLRATSLAGPLLALAPVQGVLKQLAEGLAKGPTAEQRATERSLVWGEVTGAAGRRVAMRLVTPEAYALTALSTVAAVRRLLESPPAPGALTPSQAFGADFVLGLPGVALERVAPVGATVPG